MTKFMILMREEAGAWASYAPEEQQRLLQLYYDWVAELRASSAFVDGNPLDSDKARLLRTVDGAVVDEPYTESKGGPTGYFVVEAEDWDAAVEIARGCPALTHGETVELRRVGHV